MFYARVFARDLVRQIAARCIPLLCLLCLTGPAAAFEPTAQYEKLKINGWTVYVSSSFAKQPRARKVLIDKITRQTRMIAQSLPAKHLRVMRKADLWVETGEHYKVLARYLGSKTEILQEDLNIAKYRDVEIYGDYARTRYPTLILHELTHVYHDRKLSWQDNRLKRLFKRFKFDHGKAKDRCGPPSRAYALTNHREFFATFTEAYFTKTCGYPHDRETIRQRHPEMHALLTKIWGP